MWLTVAITSHLAPSSEMMNLCLDDRDTYELSVIVKEGTACPAFLDDAPVYVQQFLRVFNLLIDSIGHPCPPLKEKPELPPA